ncbi:hypothetical protein V6N12_022001 [Hibiscus sabdariffa]|uniref:Uncharacterized protein n=1 Tax=Hibiscus sabdariffa TaxID=183260 RepID=A0ABR2FTP4_9ROSI
MIEESIDMQLTELKPLGITHCQVPIEQQHPLFAYGVSSQIYQQYQRTESSHMSILFRHPSNVQHSEPSHLPDAKLG